MHQLIAALALGLTLAATQATADPLPSWRAGPAKEAITGFVSDVTRADGPEFVPPAQRIAVFDNDGTLWVEQPTYSQLAFVLDRVKALAPQHPQWREQQPFKAAIDGDLQTLQWTTAGEGRRLGLILHHTDAEREYAYDREGHIGRLDQALALAPENGWLVISMKEDWNQVFPAS